MRLRQHSPCQRSRRFLDAEQETYATLSLSLEQTLKDRRIEAKCYEDDACGGGVAVPYPENGAVTLSEMLDVAQSKYEVLRRKIV